MYAGTNIHYICVYVSEGIDAVYVVNSSLVNDA